MAKDPSEKRERANEQEPIDPKEKISHDDDREDDADAELEIENDDLVEEIDLDDLQAMEGPDA